MIILFYHRKGPTGKPHHAMESPPASPPLHENTGLPAGSDLPPGRDSRIPGTGHATAEVPRGTYRNTEERTDPKGEDTRRTDRIDPRLHP